MNNNDRAESKWSWASVMLTSLLIVVASALFTKRIVNALIYILRWLPIVWLVVIVFRRAVLKRVYDVQLGRASRRRGKQRHESVHIVLMIIGWLLEVFLGISLVAALLLFLVWLSEVIRWRYPLALFLDFQLESQHVEYCLNYLFDILMWQQTQLGKSTEAAALLCLGLTAVSILGYGHLCAKIAQTLTMYRGWFGFVFRSLSSKVQRCRPEP